MTAVSRKRADGKYHFGYFERRHYSPIQKHLSTGGLYSYRRNSFSATSLFAGALKGQKNVTLVGKRREGVLWQYGLDDPGCNITCYGIRFRLPRYRLSWTGTGKKMVWGFYRMSSPRPVWMQSQRARFQNSQGKGIDQLTGCR